MHHRASDGHRGSFILKERRARQGVRSLRALGFCVALSLTAVGLLGTFASDLVPPDRAVGLGEALRLGPGSHVLVRALLERVRPVAGGAAVGSATDCAGTRATVFFPEGAPPESSFTLVLLKATVALYNGASELVVAAPEGVRPAGEGAHVLSPDELLGAWKDLLCRPVAFAGRVAWGHVRALDGRDGEVGVLSNSTELKVELHSDAFIELTVEVGARVSFVGVLATADGGQGPVVHVRL